MRHILKCTSCNNYTLKDTCPACGAATVQPKPPKFTLDDRFASYRRKAKESAWKEKGLL
ncbi:MAG: RNA-protein complex protein Nop10 [Nanoarchaeota archaeon]|nr:RNA-protein complex protein Nop10 [Nanoarchaeota archaeon]MBU1704573.1 RNA-protein complex protein Nop10 [Nanoarchaeota archaeon]